MKQFLYTPIVAILLASVVSCGENESPLLATETETQIDETKPHAELKDSTVYHFIVASQQMNTNFEVIPYIIKKSKDSNWEYLWDPIAGFDYEKGYEYEIEANFVYYDEKVIQDDLQDVGLGYYQLIDVISKEKKESIGIEDLVNPTLN